MNEDVFPIEDGDWNQHVILVFRGVHSVNPNNAAPYWHLDYQCLQLYII